jgi:AraC-like DNA-binding protein
VQAVVKKRKFEYSVFTVNIHMTSGADEDFLKKLRREIDDNLTNEQFSVEALAKNIGMSRSQLHRRLNSVTGQSVSQFIREHRLSLGMALLKEGDLTAAEVSDRIGFGSPTYFSKCFNEFYGYTPGEVKHKALTHRADTTTTVDESGSKTEVLPAKPHPDPMTDVDHAVLVKPGAAEANSAQPWWSRSWIWMLILQLVRSLCIAILPVVAT